MPFTFSVVVALDSHDVLIAPRASPYISLNEHGITANDVLLTDPANAAYLRSATTYAVVAGARLDAALQRVADRVESAHEANNNALVRCFVVGGAQMTRDAIEHPRCVRAHVVRVVERVTDRHTCVVRSERRLSNGTFDLISFTRRFTQRHESIRVHDVSAREGRAYVQYHVHDRRHEEEQYLDLIRDVVRFGVARPDRTGVGTRSVFGRTMRFNLQDNVFPLLTTKRVFWRGVVEELLWFVSGSTDTTVLQSKNVRIWDGNASREFLDSVGLAHHDEGDLGPVYGFQWRHFGAAYDTMHADYTGKGVDQLSAVVDAIKSNPTSRRIVMSAWNPTDLPQMALPPCHLLAQFYVARGRLSCQMYQRSADIGLGVPFNIASYALLTRMMAHVCHLEPGEFVHVLGDAHVYESHVDPLREQMLRTPGEFPTLHIRTDRLSIDEFTADDFELRNYRPQRSIKMKMAV